MEANPFQELLSFMGAFSGYNKKLMHLVDQENTSFIKIILFTLKNAGAIYQWLVNKMFLELLGKTIEVYIDDRLHCHSKGDRSHVGKSVQRKGGVFKKKL